MSANSDPPLTPEIREEIEDAQWEIHKSFWNQLLPFCLDQLTLATAFLGPSEPSRPKRRMKVLAILNFYGIQLFNCEHKYYPQAEELPLWRSALALKIVEMVMAQVDQIERGLRSLQFHVSHDEMRHSVFEALKGYIGKLPPPVGRLQVHKSETEPRPPIENETTPHRSAISQQLKELIHETEMTNEQVAAAIGIDVRSLYRHLAGHALRSKHHEAYEALFSDRLKRRIQIERTTDTPRKRHNLKDQLCRITGVDLTRVAGLKMGAPSRSLLARCIL